MSNFEIEDQEVTWKVKDITVYASITSPKSDGTHPALVFVAGSGPTDRNWCSPLLPGTNGTAKILAEELSRHGYVTLRYDKLGSGPHVKENLPRFVGKISMETFVEELAGGIETVLSKKNTDCSRLFALTNSEGAIHAVNYQLGANKNRFKGLILTGAPGRTIEAVARSQILEQLDSVADGEILMGNYDRAIAEFKAGRPMMINTTLPKGVQLLLHSLESPSNLPFSRELWSYSLADHITKVTDPILIMIGKKDIQVDWQLDGKSLERRLGQNSKAVFAYPENANHLLKREEMPREKLTPEYVGQHYNSQDSSLDDDAEKAIFSWLAQISGNDSSIDFKKS